MAVWQYTGRTASGKETQGEINAPNKDGAQLLLRKKRIVISKLRKKPLELSFDFKRGVAIRDLARFTRQFSAMNSAGLPLIQCLDTLAEQESNKRLKTAVEKISLDVQSGNTLADSFSKHKDIFSDLYCHMLAAGEAGGILDEILMRLADYQEKADALLRKIKKAMYYPVFVVLVSVCVILFLLIKVVPIFADMFQSNGGALPAPTALVMNISSLVQMYWSYGFIAALSGGYLLYRWSKTEKGAFAIDHFLLKAPVFGPLIRKSSVARFTRTLSTLLSAGVSILESLQITSRTSGNKVMEKGILTAIDSITGGQTIAEPLKATKLFPPMVIQMISIGEKTGGLSEMLGKVSEFFENEVDAAIDGLTSLIEPMIIVFLGVFIGGILIAMYLPMFDMASSIH